MQKSKFFLQHLYCMCRYLVLSIRLLSLSCVSDSLSQHVFIHWLPRKRHKHLSEPSRWEPLQDGTNVSEGPFNRRVGWYAAMSALSKYTRWRRREVVEEGGGGTINFAWTWNFNQNLMVVMEKKQGTKPPRTTCRKLTKECVRSCKWICLSPVLVRTHIRAQIFF